MTELIAAADPVVNPLQSEGARIYNAEKRPCIAIIGFADSKKHFPFDDERWWIWGVNDVYAYLPRVDVTFEIHHTLNMGNRRNPEHEAVLKGGGRRGAAFKAGQPPTPIFMQEASPEYPTVIAFPKERVISEFGKRNYEMMPGESAAAPGASYFTNSIGWMIALAILELTDERTVEARNEETGEIVDTKQVRIAKPGARLAIYGVSMAADSEYIAQRPNVEFWIAFARGCGIEVSVPDDAHVLKAATLYGYATSHPLRVRLQADKEGLREKTIALQQTEAQLSQQLEQVRHELTAVRANKSYIDSLDRTLVIDTEIAVGAEETGPQVGRTPVLLETSAGAVSNINIQPSDNQPVTQGAV